MKHLLLGGLVALAVAAAVVLVPRYDRLVGLREQTYKEWAQVEIVLQRRYELLPNLVETARGFAGMETSVLQEITEAYTGYKNAQGVDQKIAASQAAETALRRLPLYMGRLYPNLASARHFAELMKQLERTEDQVADRRLKYNEAVGAFNVERRSVGGRVVGRMFNMPPAIYYEPPAQTQDQVVMHGQGGPHQGLAPTTTQHGNAASGTNAPGPAASAPTANAGLAAGAHYRLMGVMNASGVFTALIATQDGKTHTLHRGARIPGTDAFVASIGDGWVNLEERIAGQPVVSIRLTQ